MLNSDGNHEPSQEQHTGGLEVVDTDLNGREHYHNFTV